MAEISNNQLFYGILKQQMIKEEDSKLVSCKNETILESLKEKMNTGEVFELMFSGKKNNGSLFTYMDNVRIELPVERMNNQLMSIVSKGRVYSNRLLDTPIKVKVSSIIFNLPQGPLVLVNAYDEYKERKTWKQRRAEAAIKELTRMAKTHDYTRVPARVIIVNKTSKCIVLDLCGYGIKGVCRADEWSAGVVNDMMLSSIKPGTIVSVSIKSAPKKPNGAFRCSRISENAYAGLEELYPKGSIVDARLVDKKENYGWFCIDNFDAVQLFCYFPWLRDEKWKNAQSIREMVEGRKYRIIITDVDEKKAKFRGRIIGELKALN